MRRLELMAGAAMLLSAGAAFADALTVASAGGAYQKAQAEAYFKPFQTSTGISVDAVEYNGDIAKIRANAGSGAPAWSVVNVGTQPALQGCEDGLFLKLDWSKIGDRSKFLEGATTDCAVGTIVYSTVVAYDADRLTAGPATIADLFDTAKFPGKRALQKKPFGNLEFALMADGVPRDQIYSTLRTPAGVDRAFKKLDTIKKDIVWWEAGAQPAQLLASGEVVMATAWNARIHDAAQTSGKNFRIMWDGQVPDYDFWVIPKAAPDMAAAYRFLAYASDAANMSKHSQYISYGPTNRDAIPLIPPATLAELPTAPANSTTAVAQDYYFWHDHGDEMRTRFDAWLAQ